MCGILGLVSKNHFPEQNILQDAATYLKYRGPDDSGWENIQQEDVRLNFYHSRLSIIDLSSGGHQPMWSASQKTLISFNGEIYNYKELKKELESRGYQFKTQSDTEVILASYEIHGIEKTLEAIDGMFAFAIWSQSNQELILARDRFGKKPLYYHLDKDAQSFSFSSDIRSLQILSKESLSIDMHSLGYYFAELGTPSNDSIWKEIKKLEGGHWAQIKISDEGIQLRKKRYWSLKHRANCTLSKEEITEHTWELIKNAVKKRLVADVHVAALLSGGVDSTLVVAAMNEVSNEDISTYTVGYKGLKIDESVYANQVVDKFKTRHKQLYIDSISFDDLDNIISEYGEPFADSSMIPTYLISKEISKYEKVLLGGDGGDELFAGYDSYYKVFKMEKVKQFRHLSSLTGILSKVFPSYRTRFLNQLLQKANNPKHQLLNRDMGFSALELHALLNNEEASSSLDNEHKRIFEFSKNQNTGELLKVMNASLRTRLANDYLVKVDRASMYASVEMRSPFLDKDLAEFAATLTNEQLYQAGEPKSILKNILRRDFPEEFIYRQKMGFVFPLQSFFKEHSNKIIESIMDTEYPFEMNKELIKPMLDQFKQKEIRNIHKIYALLVLSRWCDMNRSFFNA